MPKAHILNVKKHLEHEIRSIEDMLNRNGKYVGGLVLPPIDVQNLTEIKFIAEAILRKHAKRGTRKDVYIGNKS